jgi:mRNA-degrading endonuclease RelE of RelBE toxin-antitoxin system
VGLRSGPSSGIIARAPRDVVLLERAQRDLMAVPAVERRLLADAIDALSQDALPRGVEGVQGRFRDHLRLRVGRFRLLYRVEDAVLAVVAVVST